MLGKLIKYEFKTVNRLMIPLHLGLIAITIIGRFYIQLALNRPRFNDGNVWMTFADTSLIIFYVIALVAIALITSIYLSILLDGVAVIVYLYLLTYLTGHNSWFYGLGLPIVLLVTAVVEVVTFCIRKLPMSFLTGALYLISGIAVLCVGLELLIDRFLRQEIALGWSAIVLTICVIVDITIATLLSRRRLRNAVRRRLHF